jgi:threonine/homoserine/homoserine lactone efflux protein
MKIGPKLILFWLASLALFVGVGAVYLLVPDWLSGVHGLIIYFFLGYCAIIVVAQALAFRDIIRHQRQISSEKSRSYRPEIGST